MEALLALESSETIVLNAALEKKIVLLEQRMKEMDESMRYAGMLQQSILPNEIIFKNIFHEAFVYFKPKDIVSGDFYWIFQHNSDVYFAVGDCTGHGVPGAMVNIAGNSILRQLIRTEGLTDPAKIVQLLDVEITGLFNDHLTSGKRRDGIDMAFCRFNLETRQGTFSSAGRPMILLRNGVLVEFEKGPSIGYFDGEKEFESVHFALEPNDTFYLFTDGYTDQFGGENIKKFNRKRFRQLLGSLSELNMEQQKKELDLTFEAWKGQNDQIDDVCVIGLKI